MKCLQFGSLVVLGLAGCGSTDHLVLTTYTKVGIEVSTVDGKPTQLVLGYKRFEGALVPVDPHADPETEAMSTFAAFNMRNGWWDGVKIDQFFATGKSATDAVKNQSALQRLLSRMQEEEEAGE